MRRWLAVLWTGCVLLTTAAAGAETASAQMTKLDALNIARSALTECFHVSLEELNVKPYDIVFTIDIENEYGAPREVPFWKVGFGYGQAYGAAISADGAVIAVRGPGTPYYPVGSKILDGAVPAVWTMAACSPAEAEKQARKAVADQIPAEETLWADCNLVNSPWYMWGEEPVWIVTLTAGAADAWYVLLTQDGTLLDAAAEGKLFDTVCYLH